MDRRGQKPSIFGLDESGETRDLIAKNYMRAQEICGIPILIRKEETRRALRPPAAADCASLKLPAYLGPAVARDPATSAE